MQARGGVDAIGPFLGREIREACEDEAIFDRHDFHRLDERYGESGGGGRREDFRVAEVFLHEQDVANETDVLSLEEIHQEPVREGLPGRILHRRDEYVCVKKDGSRPLLGHPRHHRSASAEGREFPSGQALRLGFDFGDDGGEVHASQFFADLLRQLLGIEPLEPHSPLLAFNEEELRARLNVLSVPRFLRDDDTSGAVDGHDGRHWHTT